MDSIKRLFKYLATLRREYVLASTAFVMEPFEAKIFHAIVIIVILMFIYSTYVFMPAQMLAIVSGINQIIFYPSRQGDSALYADPHFKREV